MKNPYIPLGDKIYQFTNDEFFSIACPSETQAKNWADRLNEAFNEGRIYQMNETVKQLKEA
jgi:hypothetical protein